MQAKNTPPTSPCDIEEIEDDDDDQLQEEDILQVIELDDTEAIEADSGDELSPDVIVPDDDDAAYVFQKHSGPVFCCHVEPKEGNLAVTGGQDDKGFVWETQTGNVILECDGYKDSVTYVEFSYDGSYVAVSDIGGTIKVWKMSSKTLAWEISISDILWMKWHHAANVLSAGVEEGEVYVWRIPSGDCKILAGHGSRAECGRFMLDGKRLAVGYNDGVVKICDIKSSSVLHQIAYNMSQFGSVISMDAHTDNNLIIIGTTEGKALLVTTQTGKMIGSLDCRTSAGEDSPSVETVAFYKDTALSLAATGTVDGMLHIWDISKQVHRHAVPLRSGITKIIWDRKKPVVYVACLNGYIEVYDALNGSCLMELFAHQGDVLDINLSMDCSTLLSTSDDKTAKVFKVTC